MKLRLLIAFFVLSFGVKAQISVYVENANPCLNETVMLVAAGADQYSWAPSTHLDTNIGDTVYFSAAAGSYNITVYGVDTVMNSTDTVVVSITVHSLPEVTIVSSASSSNNFICLGSSATLTASSGSATTYEWSPSSSLNNTNSSQVIATPTVNTNYFVTVTDVYGCTGTQSKTVNVNSNHPTVNATTNKSRICPGESTSMTAEGGGINFNWSPSGSLNTSSAKTVIASPTSTTTYSVTATANACSTIDTIKITVLPAPSMSLSQSSAGNSICLDETDVITANCPECQSYTWAFPNSTLNTTSGVQVVSPNNVGDISIHVKGYGTNGCFTGSSIIVTVDDCYLGEPFGVDEPNNEISVAQIGSTIKVSAGSSIQDLQVFNLLGDKVYQSSGNGCNRLDWMPQNLTPGIYIIKVKSRDQEATKKLYVK